MIILGEITLLTDRELAIIFWLIILFIYCLIDKGTRKALANVLKVFCSKIFQIEVFSSFLCNKKEKLIVVHNNVIYGGYSKLGGYNNGLY